MSEWANWAHAISFVYIHHPGHLKITDTPYPSREMARASFHVVNDAFDDQFTKLLPPPSLTVSACEIQSVSSAVSTQQCFLYSTVNIGFLPDPEADGSDCFAGATRTIRCQRVVVDFDK